MTAEDELCVLMGRGHLSPEVRKRALELLARPIRWPLVLEHARAFDILPLLYRALRELDFGGVPDPIRTELERIFTVNALRNELLAEELARIVRILGDAGLPVIMLKGIALAESLYGDSSLRTHADIDILVPPNRFRESSELLVASGYRAESTEPPLLDLLARYGKDCTLTREDGMHTYLLELHCGLVWGGPLERPLLNEVWSDARAVTFRGIPALALSDDWQFLYLAEHAARHGPPSLKWLLDLDRLCRVQAIKWAEVSTKARRLGWEDAVVSSLTTCASLFGTPLGPPLSRMAQRRNFDVSPPRHSDFQAASDMLFSLGLLNTWTAKAQYLAIRLLIPTPADCRFLKLPPALFFGYYLLRPVRVFCKTAGWLFRFGFSTRIKKRGSPKTEGRSGSRRGSDGRIA
jgi:Uncharacterised nucleotidyltransferase